MKRTVTKRISVQTWGRLDKPQFSQGKEKER